MEKTFLPAILCIILLIQPIFLFGQGASEAQDVNDPFSDIDRILGEDEEPSPIDEYYIGRAVAANILTNYELYTQKAVITHYLNCICQALVINSPQPAIYNGYHLMILDSQEYNAFATPGGHIFITKGLVEVASSEDALAAIIAHEMAHIILKHGMKMMKEMKFDEEFDSMRENATSVTGIRNDGDPRILAFRNAVSEFFDAMMKSGYSKPQEFEADNMAVALLAATGYDPHELLEMLKVLQKVQHHQRGGFNSTHPSPAERIRNITPMILHYKVNNTHSRRILRFNNFNE